MYYSLLIDGEVVKEADTVKPLISELTNICKSDGFSESATIRFNGGGFATASGKGN